MRTYEEYHKHHVLQGKKIKKIGARDVKIDFDGGDVSSDGGLFLVSKIDKTIGLLPEAAQVLKRYDTRQQGKVKHGNLKMLRQRVHGIIAGWEDLNDHDDLRYDANHQMAADTTDTLASRSTLCRFENTRSTRIACFRLIEVIVDNFIQSFSDPPEELVLDFDATDDAVHGEQEKRFFHGYYDHYCFLPLYVFCGERLLVPYLRPSNQDAATHAAVILRMLVKRFRKKWPEVRIIFRGDSDFCRWKMLSWCDRNDVGYIVGIAKNARLKRFTSRTIRKAEKTFNRTGKKAKLYNEIYYAARTWDRKRRVIVKAEHSRRGPNTRYVISNISEPPKYLYEEVYCARGNMENRIKEQQLYLFADRTSSHWWWTNQFRLILSSLAYILIERLRSLGLKGTTYCRAQAHTIREKFIKIGAVIVTNTRSLYIHLSSSYPLKGLFSKIVESLVPV